jgi:hypothetical protein
MQRRDLLRAFGAATALAFIPYDAVAAWTRVAGGIRPAAGLSDAQLALVGAIADTILPRTDAPGATDVGVPAFVNVIVGENYTDADRAAFLAGLDAIDAQAQRANNGTLASLSVETRAQVIDAIEHAPSRRDEPARTYWRLEGLIVHGYFTSERVSKDVLHVEVMPGRFEGSAPLATKAAGSSRDMLEMNDHA